MVIPRTWIRVEVVAREMGSPSQARNRRRRTREGPEPALSASTLVIGVAPQGVEG